MNKDIREKTAQVQEETLPSQGETPSLPMPQDDLADYEILGKVGEGTQGHVFRARDKRMRRIVAIKQLRIASVSNWKEYDLFAREARVLQSLDIPGVARFYEARECLDAVPPSAYIVQEFIEGKTLASMLREGKRLPVQQIYSILVQSLEILRKLHKHDPVIIHRDIKPSNLILTPEGRVYLIDFGAVANPQVQGGGSTVAGTYGYMPPEQMMGHPVPESDVYSLAATAVHLFSGVSPEDMDTADFHLLFEPHMQSMPSALIYTLRAMLDPDVKRRFCDIPELIRIFTQFQTGNYEMPLAIAKLQNDLAVMDASKKREWDKKLANVEYINAPGNVDLWQQLPNQTPRKIPKGYRNPSSSDYFLTWASLKFKMQHRFSSAKRGLFAVFLMWAVKWFLLIGFFILLCAFIWELFGENHPGLLFLSCFVIALICVLLYFPLSKGFKKLSECIAHLHLITPANMFHSLSNSHTILENNSIRKSCYRKILKYGEKTLAMITDIQYIPQPDGLFESQGEIKGKSDPESNRLSSESRKRLVQLHAPLFKIQYRFNPENDDNPWDLVHEVYTHTPPEDHYRIGDALPILYLVQFSQQGNRKTSTVYSTPFPLPMHEFLSLDQIVGYSTYSPSHCEK